MRIPNKKPYTDREDNRQETTNQQWKEFEIVLERLDTG